MELVPPSMVDTMRVQNKGIRVRFPYIPEENEGFGDREIRDASGGRVGEPQFCLLSAGPLINSSAETIDSNQFRLLRTEQYLILIYSLK
ncbi:hypothetical protein GWI33_005652 [Rhynchophorus ferrugineus]|uniref:Uncharacterized protein n=1 Tax=Rhynchophorus ferrugineus TaxID=354439 RepID=A0A834IK82_RHYFE|nr:hypothetical protein GWI33_005652 [Rhynchophorus ferrugineus]